MKKAIETHCFGFALLIFALFANVIAFAQDGGATVSKTTTTSSSSAENVPVADWYTAPWVWIVGGLVLVLIIVALTRNSNKTSATTTTRVTRTTEVD